MTFGEIPIGSRFCFEGQTYTKRSDDAAQSERQIIRPFEAATLVAPAEPVQKGPRKPKPPSPKRGEDDGR